MRTPTHIMVHHSLTADGKTVSWGAIETFHTSWRVGGDIITYEKAMALRAAGSLVEPPWLDIGYHAGVELTSEGFYALYGRGLHLQASACPQGGMNSVALHVCCVGNFDLGPPNTEIIRVLIKRIIKPWMSEFAIPVEHIVGHRDYNPHKTCPGTQFDLDLLRRMIR